MTALAQNRLVLLASAIGLGLFMGAAVAKHPSYALLIGVGVTAVMGLMVLGDRAFAWGIVLVAVAPWYPFINDVAAAPRVPQKVLCAAIAGAPLVPWLWSILSERQSGTFRRPSRRALLYGLVFFCLAISIHDAVGGIQPMIDSGNFGLLFAGVAFLCARRFAKLNDAWGPAALAGLIILVGMGLLAYAQDRSNRVGYFTGYPITYGALVVGLAPLALVQAARYSRYLAIGLGAIAALVLIFSESRSSWVAAVGVLLVLTAMLIRLQRWRALRAVAALAAISFIAIMSTGSLHGIVERKLSSDVTQSDSVTHRTWSYGYALGQIKERPFFGGGAPGYSAEQAADQTDIGAVDNGYLSITVDTGIFGLAAVLVPILVAFSLLGRWLWFAYTPPAEDLALALGITGMAIVTIFYDSFYWAQIILLLTAMGGTLSAREYALRSTARGRSRRRQRRLSRRSRRDFGFAGPSL
ncbi:O-antigen ligase family protein [Baekduia sp. Peel2402]|uniref:O-antigen ligase family protein n=1 Tax=Baekduia sp. Peel2402 TaxID=3458296 RepID=UPI00403E8F5B